MAIAPWVAIVLDLIKETAQAQRSYLAMAGLMLTIPATDGAWGWLE